MKIKPIATNRRAEHEFSILERLEVGIELKGPEVKSLRAQKATLNESFARVVSNELYLYNMHISPYEYASYANPDPKRRRKLLAKKNQIAKLAVYTSQSGATLIPLKIYFNERGLAKIELGLAKGKRKYDKREAIKKRETRRDVERRFSGKAKI